MIFDGKAFASEIETRLRQGLLANKRIPKVVSILVEHDPASEVYTRLKKQAAERVGIQFEVIRIDGERLTANGLRQTIAEIGKREDVIGVMVQLPLPENFKGRTLKVLEAIPLGKDVDGLRWEQSKVVPATVRAILSILDKIAKRQSSEHSLAQDSELGEGIWEKKFVVLGANGAVGKPLIHFLRERGVDVTEVEWDTSDPARRLLAGDVVISCVGKAGLVKREMVKAGVIAIDVGMSMANGKVVGDMTQEVYQKASVAVPVPGGVGPVTIACLMQNAISML